MKSTLNVKKHLNWSKLYLVIISALGLKVNKQKNHLPFSTKNFIPQFHKLRENTYNNSNVSNEKQGELKMKFQEEISKVSLPVSADLINDFKLF